MDTQEISAFAAYSSEKKAGKKKKSKSLKNKTKLGKKKKLNSPENLISPVMSTATSVTETSSTPENSEKKIKKKAQDKDDLIRTILNLQKHSIFKDCTVSTKTNNTFLDEGLPAKKEHKKKLKGRLEDLSKVKKAKKIKLMNGEDLENSGGKKSSPKTLAYSHINGDSSLNNKDDSAFLGENSILDQNTTSEETKDDLSERSASKKSLKKLKNKKTKIEKHLENSGDKKGSSKTLAYSHMNGHPDSNNKDDSAFLGENRILDQNTTSEETKDNLDKSGISKKSLKKVKNKKTKIDKHMNGGPELSNKDGSKFFEENSILDHNRANEETKDNLSEMTAFKMSKKRKKINKKHLEDSEVSKKRLKSNEGTFSVESDKAATEFGSDEVITTESVKLKGKKGLKKLGEESELTKVVYSDSVKVGENVLAWMLSPLSVKNFFEDCWEQKPLHISHNDDNYFKDICTLESFNKALKDHDMYFTRNIDVTSYVDGERHTENPEGKAKPSMVWDFYRKGKSIRLLNPQTYIPSVRTLNTALQEFFHCFVGANIYLTPPGTQGFAPHYDDIEAFVLQLEGEKNWKLYMPRSPEEVLPRESSKNFKEDEIGQPFLEVTLKPGDLLYFPRGIIHQANSLPHSHSLHITVSCYQKNSWADLIEKVIPIAVQRAISEDVEFRRGLPLGFFNYMGLIHSEKSSDYRAEMIKKFEELFRKILDYCPLDAAVDQIATNHIHDALPPCLFEEEKLHGAERNCSVTDENFLNVLKESEDKNLKVKLIRSTCVRLVAEEEEIFLYYTTDNSLVYHEQDVSRICISASWGQAVEHLIHSYPNFVDMKELPVSLKVNKPGKWKRIIEFVYFLWQKGLVLFDKPLLQICS